jgi:hypothetical protein
MTYKITIENLGEDVIPVDTALAERHAREVLAKFPTFKNTIVTAVDIKRNRDCFPSIEWRVAFVVPRETDAGESK